ncbi:hypothetical protein DFH27DRAFT_567354 [Peziza echinospora]|nr:hypothetical protein DFH27DRAFT_567354 [Peziza echinospora]
MGHIYFFYRPRVSVENPQSLQDVQRSYILLRPLPSGAKFKSDNPEVGEEGSPRALEDAGNNNRLLVVPKKKFPATGSHERLLTFVDKANCSIEEIKETVLKGSNYQTKT